MSPSPSGSYKSRVVRGVVRQVRRILDRGQTTVRRVQVAASWSAQILLYPVYALFQTSRVIGRTLERSQEAEARLSLEADLERYDIPLTLDTAIITAETPIQNVLHALQNFELPSNCAVQGQEPEAIRAIASQMDTHELVLVTNRNQILRLRDPAQQAWLKQRLIYEIAVFNQEQRTRSLPFQPVIRALQGISAAIRRRFSASSLSLPDPSLAPLLPVSLTVDQAADVPIKRSLLTVRHWLTAAEVPLVKASRAERSLTAAQTASLKPAKIQIRGVASQLPSQKLVLVSRTNDIVDILSPQQEAALHQRIAWETAHFQRYLRLQGAAPPSFQPLRPPANQNSLLPPIRAFQWLMTWMQSGPVAMATNLFQEASWRACPLPSAADSTATTFLPAAQGGTTDQDRRPSHRFKALKGFSAKSLKAAPPSSLVTATQTGLQSTAHQTVVELDPEGQLRHLDRPGMVNDARSSNYIETDVTWAGYEQSWLERIMQWLDRLFLWVEESLSQLWKKVMRQ